MFKKMIDNQNKSLEIIIKKSCSPVNRQNTHYVAPCLKFSMVLHILCYEEYTDFKNYMRDILDVRYANVAAENELVADERKNYSRTIKFDSLEEKINLLSKEK